MSRSITLGLLAMLVAGSAGAAARTPRAPRAAAPAPVAVEVAPRTPLYCEGASHTVQPMVYGDYGDLIAAYDRLHQWPGKMLTAAPTKTGEASFRLVFTAPPDDPKSPDEVVAFTATRHEGGYVLRAVSDRPKGLRAKRVTGSAMCFKVLEMLLDADAQHALAYRKAWGERHRDSTGR